jgi:hypothetical protein
VTDIFREVEEEVRRERFEQLWKKYGDYIIAGAALLIIAAAGFQLWRVYQQREQAKASATYAIASQMLDGGAAGSAALTFDKLAQTAPGGYAKLALLQKANSLLAAGNVTQAVDVYKQVAAKGDPLLAPVARIRAAWASVDTAPRSDIDVLLKPLLDQTSPWHPMAREIIAYSDYRSGATAKAQAEFLAISKDKDAPPAVRRRSEVMAGYLAAGGDQNFGTVPPPPAPPQIQAQPQTGAAAPQTAPAPPTQGAKPK